MSTPSPKSRRRALCEAAAVAALLHGIFTVALPYSILRLTDGMGDSRIGFAICGWILVGAGAVLYLRAAYELLELAESSASPLDTATSLRVSGLYRWSRNPLLLGVVLILLGEALAFQSLWLLLYASAYGCWLNVFVSRVEEPRLQERFGAAYEDYAQRVPRWIGPRRRRGKTLLEI